MITSQQGARESADIIGKILGDPYYLLDHEPAGLTEAVLGLQPTARLSFDISFSEDKAAGRGRLRAPQGA